MCGWLLQRNLHTVHHSLPLETCSWEVRACVKVAAVEGLCFSGITLNPTYIEAAVNQGVAVGVGGGLVVAAVAVPETGNFHDGRR